MYLKLGARAETINYFIQTLTDTTFLNLSVYYCDITGSYDMNKLICTGAKTYTFVSHGLSRTKHLDI